MMGRKKEREGVYIVRKNYWFTQQLALQLHTDYTAARSRNLFYRENEIYPVPLFEGGHPCRNGAER